MHFEGVKNDGRMVQRFPATHLPRLKRDVVSMFAGIVDSAPQWAEISLSKQTRIEGAITNILVPTDFSSCAAQALRKAIHLARQCGAAVTLLHVVDVNAHIPSTGPANAEKIERELWLAGRRQLDQTVLELAGEKVEVQTVIQEGLPYERICEAARQADLIVFGKSKPKPFWHLFSRRTVKAVLDRAPCPVLVES